MSCIGIYFEDIKPLPLKKTFVKEYVKQLITKEISNVGDINIIFCSDDYLLKMNQQYLEHNYYTDIITFNYVEENTISGDLFISLDRIKENAHKYITEFNKELLRVIFHGILHLIGYNDKTEDEIKEMREKEEFYLEQVNFKEIEL